MLESVKWAVGFIAMVVAYVSLMAAIAMVAYVPYTIIKLYLF